MTGGIDLAAEWAGFETVGQCEWADYPTKVLEKHWPDVPRWRDVRDVTTKSVRERGIREITLLSGGFPCQPHSFAGKHKGSTDERDLWPEFRRVISEVTPKWILGENVPGLFASDNRRFFGRVLADLAEMGYFVGWSTYGASTIGARHRRERIFIVAYSGCEYGKQRAKIKSIIRGLFKDRETRNQFERSSQTQNVDYPNSSGHLHREFEKQPTEAGEYALGESIASGKDVFNTASERWETSGNEAGNISERESEWESWSADSFNRHIWETEPNVGRVANGIPNVVDRLKCLGNAVVPQQVYPILKAIAEIERG